MNFQEEFILRSTMTRTKKEILEYINQNNIYFPPNLESKLLKWNSLPLINFITREIEISFGIFFYQMLKLSQNQRVKDYFQEVIKNNLKDLQIDQFIQICHCIFQKQSLNPFPKSTEFQPIGDFIQEIFIYEKFFPDRQPSYSYYTNLKDIQVSDINEQDIKYRILLYVSGEQQGNIAHIIFSTNYDVGTLFSIPNQNIQQINTQQINTQQINTQQINTQSINTQQINTQQINTKNQIQFQQPSLFPQPQFINQNQKQTFNQTLQINQQQINQEGQEKTIQQSNANQKWQLIKNNCFQSQMIFPQQQQINPQQQKFQTTNTSCNINNLPQEQYSKIRFVPFQNQNEIKQASTGTIQQLQEKFQNFSLQSQIPIQYDKFSTNQSTLSTSTQQMPEETYVFSTQQINNLQQDESNNKTVMQSRILTNYIQQKQSDAQECMICNINYNQDLNEAIMTPCCNQKVHAYCFQQDINQKAKDSMNFDKITCYSCRQSLKNYQDFLKQNISITLFGEIVKKKVLADIPMRCCKCQLAIKASEEILNKQFKLQCLSCNTMLCSLCRQEYHGQNQENQQCPSLLKEIQKAFQGMPILLCPFCYLIQTKDDKCNHVQCFNCKSDLCSACSVDRIPILAHGNHYHREGCPDYKQWIIKGKINNNKEYDKKKCQRCQESGKPCEYPMSLQEYRKLKQF